MEQLTDTPARAGWGRNVARASWISFVIAIGVNTVMSSVPPVPREMLVLLFVLLGFVLGVIALVRMAWEGRRGILVPALIGVLLNGLLILIFVSNVVGAGGPK